MRFWRRRRFDSDMDDEMRFHLEMEADRLARSHGLDPREARRRAYVAFGGVEKYKEAARDTRPLRWLDALSLDTRLGVRMLIKHRWLTLVGGFAMAVAIAIGAASFEAASELLDTTLPMPDGDRIVALQYSTGNPEAPERRVLRDFHEWRDVVVSVEQLSAFRTVQLNLASADAPPEPIKVAEITASAFALARTSPFLGRYLLPADERPDAPPVVVLGYEAWQARFGGDAQIVGRTLNIGGSQYAVAGVMPDGFKFPTSHQFWMPLRANALAYERLQGPELFVFGRLARGVTLDQAQAELTTIGQRTATANPTLYERVRLIALPYTREHLELTDPGLLWALRIAQLLIGALSVVVSVNLAILFYARTVTRLGEIAVRSALGASRGRILGQMFIEAFALAVVGAAGGLVLARLALRVCQWIADRNGSVPYWLEFGLSPSTVVYAFLLAALAALIMGVLPALKATGRRVNARLHELNARTGTRLGPIWTTLVVAQVAVAVAILPAAVYLSWHVARIELAGPGFAAEQFMIGTVVLSGERSAIDAKRVRTRQLELTRRLNAEPGVASVTFSSSVPGFAGDSRIQFADALPESDAELQDVSVNNVDLDLFDAYEAEILAGRRFDAGDPGAANVVIVNQTFVQDALKNQNPLGLRFRYARAPEPGVAEEPKWYQIVGVVGDFPTFSPSPGSEGVPTIYHPAAAGDIYPVVLSVRFHGGIPPGFTDRLRALGAEVDPDLQLRRVVPLVTLYDDVRLLWRYLGAGLVFITTTVLLLSAAGIYAMMSFMVAQRTREIGIRSALGAAPHRLLLSIFGRAARQLALGVLAGSLLSGVAIASTGLALSQSIALLVAVAAMMLTVGLVAALGPARRGLRIEASEALRVDA